MKTKKFKSVSGYLRSTGERLQIRNLSGDEATRIAAIKAGQRDIINNLLPQLGITQTIGADETPRDGVERLLSAGGDTRQVKALNDCRRWLKNYRILLSVTAVPQVTTAQGLVSVHVNGFKRDDDNVRVSMIVDVDDQDMEKSPHSIAADIAGADYCFTISSTISHLVPDAAKNRLFFSDEELFAADPAMAPRSTRSPGRPGRRYQSGGVATSIDRGTQLPTPKVR